MVRLTSATASGFLPTPVKYDSHGTWESNNYHGLGWSAKNDPGRLDERSAAAVRRPRQWPTPVKNEDRAACYTPETSFRHFEEGSHQVHLAQAVRDQRMFPAGAPGPRGTWPTPTCTQPKMPTETLIRRMSDGKHNGSTSIPLVEALQRQALGEHLSKTCPTPTHANGLRNGKESEHHPMKWQHPGHPEYGELNPGWVEWLMGWPIGWTSLEPMDLAQFDRWWAGMGGSAGTGLPIWWDADPSDDAEWLGLPVPKTVKPRDKADDDLRISRIAALGNGQVSAVVAAQTFLLASWQLPEGE